MTTATETKNEIQPAKIGDVFYASWGYDQTNVDWFVITKLSSTGKTATFTHVTGATVESNGPADRVAADPSAAICKHCSRAIRPFVTAGYNGAGTLVEQSREWRHVETGQALCYVERYYGIDVPDSWHLREGRPECAAAPETFTARLKYYSGRASANWKSYASVYAWDGASKYQTASGWGH